MASAARSPGAIISSPLRTALALVMLLAVLAAGCGSSSAPAEDRAATTVRADGEASPAETAGPEPAQPPAAAEDGEPAENDSRSGPDGTREAAPSPSELERIVRAWSEALNAEDNEAAADLFAPDALVVQGGVGILLNGRAGAVRFNSSLPCSGLIVQLETELNSVIAVFELGDRPSSACDAPPGTLAAARFVIEDGLITVWQQLPVPGQGPRSDPPQGGALT